MQIPAGLDSRALKRISGPAWDDIRPLFLDLSTLLLAASPKARATLTTIYVKYELQRGEDWRVFAVAWLRKSTEIVVGLSLPETTKSPEFHATPKGCFYMRLSKYFTLKKNTRLPKELAAWASMSAEHVS
jgi:hypothetical protein